MLCIMSTIINCQQNICGELQIRTFENTQRFEIYNIRIVIITLRLLFFFVGFLWVFMGSLFDWKKEMNN